MPEAAVWFDNLEVISAEERTESAAPMPKNSCNSKDAERRRRVRERRHQRGQ
jgi:hypothetical protein